MKTSRKKIRSNTRNKKKQVSNKDLEMKIIIKIKKLVAWLYSLLDMTFLKRISGSKTP